MASCIRQRRQGMTLMEILVTITIMVGLFAIALPSLKGIFGLERAQAAKQLATTYNYLREEAGLRNVSFRIAYDLDLHSYSVQVGDPSTLIFTTAEERIDFEEELQDELKRYTQREIEEGVAREVQEKQGRFDGLQADVVLDSRVQLPSGTRFGWVYTPQYEDPVEPRDEELDADFDEEEDHQVVYSFIFPNGYMEQTLVHLVNEEDEEDGFTIEVEPLSGRVLIHDEEVLPEDLSDWLPEEGPELNL